MIADTRLLGLRFVALGMKDALPEYAGIYYVVDGSNTVWYVGKAQNIRKRWQGKTHHRIHQLHARKNQDFRIFYEPVAVGQLSDIETARIATYQPHLNSTPTKSKKVHPTETLLRETIAMIADFSFILGIESPRKLIVENGLMVMMSHPKVLPLEVIHIYVDSQQIQSFFKLETIEDAVAAIRKRIFSTRKIYAKKWEKHPHQYPLLHRLYVGGYAVEISEWNIKSLLKGQPWTPEYHEITLAGQRIRALTTISLTNLQKQLSPKQPIQDQMKDQSREFSLDQSSISLPKDIGYGYHLRQLRCYTSECIPLLFNENVDLDCRKKSLSKIAQDYSQGTRGLGSGKSRSNLKKVSIFVRCFGFTNIQNYRMRNRARGVINGQLVNHWPVENFEVLYFLTEVNQETWQQVSSYLYDFVILARSLVNGEGYVTRFDISPRKQIKPARLTVKCEKTQTSFSIALGASREFPTFDLVKAEIRRRVASQNLKGIRLSFQAETTT